jgi:hypothetical protein
MPPTVGVALVRRSAAIDAASRLAASLRSRRKAGSRSAPGVLSAQARLELGERLELDAFFSIGRALVVDARIHVATFADRAEIALLLLLDQRHVGGIAARDDLAERRFSQVAEAQGRVGVAAGAAVDDAGRHDLHGGEQAHAGAVLVDETGTDDVDRQVAHIVVGDEAAPVVVDALRHLHRHAGLAETIEQPRDLAGLPA